MRVGLGSYALAWTIGVPDYWADAPGGMDAFGFLEYAHAAGFERVQIADNLPLHALDEAALRRLERLARQLGVAVEVGTRGIAPTHLAHYLELAQRFASPIVRIVVDSNGYEPGVEEVIETLGEQKQSFEKAGVTLALENHDRYPAATFRTILEAVSSTHLGICLDTVNSFASLEGPEAVVSTLAPFVVNLHIKDFRVVREPHSMGFRITGTPAGQGMLDVPWVVKRLRQGGARFSSILELWPAPEATLQATVAKEQRWVQESYAYLEDF